MLQYCVGKVENLKNSDASVTSVFHGSADNTVMNSTFGFFLTSLVAVAIYKYQTTYYSICFLKRKVCMQEGNLMDHLM